MTAILKAELPSPTPGAKVVPDHNGQRIPAPNRVTATASRPGLNDPLSDRTTELLIRRVLCPQGSGAKSRDAQQPVEELLPPLTSRNDVDLQLYAFLAIILRDFVQTWYSKITLDETFTAEILQIIAHCTRALEQRCRILNIESLVLDEVPELIGRHVGVYRAASSAALLHSPIKVNIDEAYHALRPFPQLDPVPRLGDPDSLRLQQKNEAAYRQILVQGILAVLLPTEDLENPCLTALVEQIFSETLIGNIIANKASQPWLLLEGICIITRLLREKKDKAKQQIVSGQHSSKNGKQPLRHHGWSLHSFFVSVLQLVIVTASIVRMVVQTIVLSSSLPSRFSQASETAAVRPDGTTYNDIPSSVHYPNASCPPAARTPIISFSIWSCLGQLIELPLRMPWVHGFLALLGHYSLRGPGRLASWNRPLDRLFSYHVRWFIKASHISTALRTLRGVLFPNNTLGKSSLQPPSTDAELRALRRRAANGLWSLLPAGLGRLYFGGRIWRRGDDSSSGDEEMIDQLEGLLDVVSSEYCNKHLMYSILELLVVRLMPELSEKGPSELWSERLG